MLSINQGQVGTGGVLAQFLLRIFAGLWMTIVVW